MREVVFDTETTGLDPDAGHRVVELGAIEMINRVETGRTLHLYFNPERDMPPEAEAIHGISARFLSDKPLFREKADEILAFLADADLVAHNARFDFKFLNAELAGCGRPPLDPGRMVDTQALARARHPGAKHTLDALCTRYGIDRSRRIKHGALLDSELLAQLYVELTGGRQIGLEIADPVADLMHRSQGGGPHPAGQIGPDGRTVVAPRHFAPSPEELARHARFLEAIENPLWHSAPAGE